MQQRERLDVERDDHRRLVLAQCDLHQTHETGAMDTQSRGLGDQELGVLLGVRRVPAVGLGVRNPQPRCVAAGQPEDQVDARVLVVDRLVKVDQDRPLGRLDRGPWVQLCEVAAQEGGHLLHELDRAPTLAVRAELGVPTAIEHDARVRVR